MIVRCGQGVGPWPGQRTRRSAGGLAAPGAALRLRFSGGGGRAAGAVGATLPSRCARGGIASRAVSGLHMHTAASHATRGERAAPACCTGLCHPSLLVHSNCATCSYQTQ
jgi:hypothetical protein